MSKESLEATIATTFLTGAGLKVTQRVAEEMLTAAMKSGDLDAVEQLGKVRGDLRKLAGQKGGAS